MPTFISWVSTCVAVTVPINIWTMKGGSLIGKSACLSGVRTWVQIPRAYVQRQCGGMIWSMVRWKVETGRCLAAFRQLAWSRWQCSKITPDSVSSKRWKAAGEQYRRLSSNMWTCVYTPVSLLRFLLIPLRSFLGLCVSLGKTEIYVNMSQFSKLRIHTCSYTCAHTHTQDCRKGK